LQHPLRYVDRGVDGVDPLERYSVKYSKYVITVFQQTTCATRETRHGSGQIENFQRRWRLPMLRKTAQLCRSLEKQC